jgi:hypothetical protein
MYALQRKGKLRDEIFTKNGLIKVAGNIKVCTNIFDL